MSYTEFPTDQIIGVHFRPGKPPSPCQPGAALCNTQGYEYGAVVGYNSNGQLAPLPNEFAVVPFQGEWSANEENGPGGIYGGVNQIGGDDPLPDVLTTTGGDALSMILDAGQISFTTQQLQNIEGTRDSIVWEVPMAEGQVLRDTGDIFSDCIAILVDEYTLDIEWNSSSGIVRGIGIQHFSNNPNFPTVLKPPPEPVFVGQGTYRYKFRWADWEFQKVLIDAGNEYSDSVGGPIFIWWMTFIEAGGWQGSANFMGDTLGALGDSYNWKISVKCFSELDAIAEG
jgi:hypothetical protein